MLHFLARLRDGSIALRVFAVPVGLLVATVAMLLLTNRQIDHAVTEIDQIHLSANLQRAQIDDLVAIAHLMHADVSRHLALGGSGLEEGKMEQIHEAIRGELDRARSVVGGLRATGVPAATDISGLLDTYGSAAEEMNELAKIDRLIAIPLLAHVDSTFTALSERINRAQAEIAASTASSIQATRAALHAERVQFWSVTGVVLVTILVAALLVARSIVGPIRRLVMAMEELAAGRIDGTIPGLGGRHELGAMAQALRVFQQSAAEVAALQQARERLRDTAEAEKRRALTSMADTIETEVGQALQQVGTLTGTMAARAEGMTGAAVRTGQVASGATESATQALINAQGVAGAAEHLTGSIHEITGHIARSTAAVGQAVAVSVETRASMVALDVQVANIGAMTDTIAEIAARTNLLALNATIEAARAGDAGRGFAVVAGEVKALAAQTARATAEITRQIAAVRGAAGGSAASVARIEQTIGEIEGIAAAIAGAIEQQSAATAEIARNAAQASESSGDLAGRIAEVSEAAAQTGHEAEAVHEDANGLATLMRELKSTVTRIVRTTTAEVERRSTHRHPVDLPCRLSVGGSVHAAHAIDLSEGGACVHDGPHLAPGTVGQLHLPDVPFPLPFTAHPGEDGRLRLTFRLDATTAEQFRGMPGRLVEQAIGAQAA
jgi:methyl-accepting chemotaxis protein